jgi:hypothetical protein
MPETTSISKNEEELLTCLGYLAMKWNYAEWCARQTLRAYVPDTSLDDPGHLKLSARMAKGIEDDLRNIALPQWLGVGRIYLERLIDAYTVARDHRNHYVHGVYTTLGTGGPMPAQALLVPVMPKNKKTQLPSFVTIADMRPIADHFHELGMYAQQVMVGFDQYGSRALNSDGTPVLAQLPALLTPLPPCKYVTT